MNRVNVPKLRFPGFEGEWKFKKIGNIAELTSSKRVYLTDYVEQGIPFYRGKEISELKLGKIPNDILYITESSYQEFKEKFGVPQKDDLLITAVGTLGNVLRIKDEAKFYFKDGNLIWFRKITEFSPFLEIALDFYKSEIEKTSIGSTQRALTMVELRKLKFPFPSLHEQQKIASFLSAVDEKIQRLSRKKELLEQYKKGVMQQLFSGKLRFKDENGKDYPDWEEKKLGDVGKIVTGKTPSTNDSNLWDGEIQFITPTDIKEDIKYQENTARYVKSSDKIKILPINSIIYTCIASIGKMCISKYPSITNQQINSLIVNEFNNFEYVYYWLFYLTPYIKTTQANTTLPIINKTDFSKFHISIPSLPEQQKIANFLSSIDAKIENTKDELEKIQLFKKGLLQKMFV